MEPTIYKPGAYKTPGVYKGAGGIYKGRGVYNEGGGGSPLPPGFTAYDYIQTRLDNKIDGVNARFFWFPIGNCIDNDGTSFIIEYEVYLNTYNNLIILTTKNNPGGSLSSGDVELELRRKNDSHGGFHHVSNTNYAWPGDMSLSIVQGRNIISLTNGIILANDTEIYNNISIFNKVSLSGKYITTANNSIEQKIYRFTIEKNDIVIYDYVPCIRELDNKIGFFDKVNNLFVTTTENSNTYYVVGNDT